MALLDFIAYIVMLAIMIAFVILMVVVVLILVTAISGFAVGFINELIELFCHKNVK